MNVSLRVNPCFNDSESRRKGLVDFIIFSQSFDQLISDQQRGKTSNLPSYQGPGVQGTALCNILLWWTLWRGWGFGRWYLDEHLQGKTRTFFSILRRHSKVQDCLFVWSSTKQHGQRNKSQFIIPNLAVILKVLTGDLDCPCHTKLDPYGLA